MRIVARSTLKRFSALHADATAPLDGWYDIAHKSEWSTPQDMAATFGKRVSILPNNRAVFDIGGNNYRLVAVILYRRKAVYVRFIGTHAAYDKIDAATI
jgi:mRNA interferase HigB